MGNSCFKYKKKDKELEDHLIRYMFCGQCQNIFLSNCEYSKHIYKCNQNYKTNSIPPL